MVFFPIKYIVVSSLFLVVHSQDHTNTRTRKTKPFSVSVYYCLFIKWTKIFRYMLWKGKDVKNKAYIFFSNKKMKKKTRKKKQKNGRQIIVYSLCFQNCCKRPFSLKVTCNSFITNFHYLVYGVNVFFLSVCLFSLFCFVLVFFTKWRILYRLKIDLVHIKWLLWPFQQIYLKKVMVHILNKYILNI